VGEIRKIDSNAPVISRRSVYERNGLKPGDVDYGNGYGLHHFEGGFENSDDQEEFGEFHQGKSNCF
jgi:hypothetical protein